MKVKILDHHIDTGYAESKESGSLMKHCAITQAVMELFPSAQRVITSRRVTVFWENFVHPYEIDLEAGKLIREFDAWVQLNRPRPEPTEITLRELPPVRLTDWVRGRS